MSMAKTLLGSENGTKKPKRGLDAELQTMARIDRLMSELEAEQCNRVLNWLRAKYETFPYELRNASPESDPVS